MRGDEIRTVIGDELEAHDLPRRAAAIAIGIETLLAASFGAGVYLLGIGLRYLAEAIAWFAR